MPFKGTSRRSALDIAREFDSFGGALNAFTAREYSCYYAKVVSSRLYEAVDLLSAMVLKSAPASADIENERRVFLQEVSMVVDTLRIMATIFFETRPGTDVHSDFRFLAQPGA